MSPFRVLIVCTGNICRSPLAERLLQLGFERISPGSVAVSSVGTKAMVGEPMHPSSERIARGYGASPEGFLAQALSPDALAGSDLVLTMTAKQRGEVIRRDSRLLKRAFTIREFARMLAALESKRRPVPEDSAAFWSSLPASAASVRHLVIPSSPAENDVIDPYGQDESVYREMEKQLIPAIQGILSYASAHAPGSTKPDPVLVPPVAAPAPRGSKITFGGLFGKGGKAPKDEAKSPAGPDDDAGSGSAVEGPSAAAGTAAAGTVAAGAAAAAGIAAGTAAAADATVAFIHTAPASAAAPAPEPFAAPSPATAGAQQSGGGVATETIVRPGPDAQPAADFHEGTGTDEEQPDWEATPADGDASGDASGTGGDTPFVPVPVPAPVPVIRPVALSKRELKLRRKRMAAAALLDAEKESTTKSKRRTARMVIAGAAALLLFATALAGAFVFNLGKTFDEQTAKFDSAFPEESTRPQDTGAINFLVIGSDSHEAALSDAQKGLPTDQRSDTMMLFHVPADHTKIYSISIMRDLWVDMPQVGKAKVNSAFAHGGVPMAVQTVESLLSQRIDHVVMVDFAGFQRITDALGGVEVDIKVPFTSTEYKGPTFKAGLNTLNGKDALSFVRERHAFPDGDYTRVKNQQAFLHGLSKKASDPKTLLDPAKLTNMVTVMSPFVGVDKGLDAMTVAGIAIELKDIKPSDFTSFTLPTGGVGTSPDGQSIVVNDPKSDKAIAEAMSSGTLGEYLKAHPPK